MNKLDKIDFCITTKVSENAPGYARETVLLDMRLRLENKAKAELVALCLEIVGEDDDTIPVYESDLSNRQKLMTADIKNRFRQELRTAFNKLLEKE